MTRLSIRADQTGQARAEFPASLHMRMDMEREA
jgi:hypothetical protein